MVTVSRADSSTVETDKADQMITDANESVHNIKSISGKSCQKNQKPLNKVPTINCKFDGRLHPRTNAPLMEQNVRSVVSATILHMPVKESKNPTIVFS